MELWYTEEYTDNLRLSMKVRRTLHTEKTQFQELAIVDTVAYGRMLLLDGLVMTTEKDEFIYHEMITHIPLNAHPYPERVLIIGGGDGGTVREAVKHASVRNVVLVEIDGRVIETARQYLPSIACSLDHPKVTVCVDDGIRYVQEHQAEFDVVIVDSTDPIGPAEGLFNKAFYQNVFNCLREDGVMVAQSESPFFNPTFISALLRDIGSIFPVCKLYLASIPTYPSGLWSFTFASKGVDPETALGDRLAGMNLKYYTPALQKAAFQLPAFVQALLP